MGVGYVLVNQTRREIVAYCHLSASKARELAGNPVAAAITTWYLLQNRGDRIGFVSDAYAEWPFPGTRREDLSGYAEVTDRVVEELIGAGILHDGGIAWADPEEPEVIYERLLTNVWTQDCPG